MRRSCSGLTFMVVHSRLGGSEVREGALESVEGHFCGGSTRNYTSTVQRRVCTIAHARCDQRSPANQYVVNDDELRRQPFPTTSLEKSSRLRTAASLARHYATAATARAPTLFARIGKLTDQNRRFPVQHGACCRGQRDLNESGR